MSEYYTRKKNKTSGRYSRYKNCDVLVDNSTGIAVLEGRDIPDIRVTKADVYHTVTLPEVGRLDKISYKYYATPQLWWVIAEANSIVDPYTQVSLDTVLRIPSIDTLYNPANGVLR